MHLHNGAYDFDSSSIDAYTVYIYIYSSRDDSFDTGTAGVEIWKMYLLNQCPQSHKQIVLSKNIGIALH